MLDTCNRISAYSSVRAGYNHDSVAKCLKPKQCCTLCPYTSICDNQGNCCEFCSNFSNCNSVILNAHFLRTDKVIDSVLLDIICYVFRIELSNDYSLSQRIEKDICVLVNAETGEIIGNIRKEDFLDLSIEPYTPSPPLSPETVREYLNTAREEASRILRFQLEVFKKQIEKPLQDKIKSIIEKYHMEYADNYAEYSLEKLDSMQKEALTFCKREIRGYTVNTDFHLKNIIHIETSRDLVTLLLRHENTGREIPVEAEILLGTINIKCSRCGDVAAYSMICTEGHVLCSNCSVTCELCGKLICECCDDEHMICSTCNAVICPDCSTGCGSCGAIICNAHAYQCGVCGKTFCLDCHNICSVCTGTVCSRHSLECGECGGHVCPGHFIKCEKCGRGFCSDHINSCGICSKHICSEHAILSEYSRIPVCDEHIVACSECGHKVTSGEVKSCSECARLLCPDDTIACKNCGDIYCKEHIRKCLCCESYYCSCKEFKSCKLCGMLHCSNCVDSHGYCAACRKLETVSANDESIAHLLALLPDVGERGILKSVKHGGISILLYLGFTRGEIVVVDKGYNVLSNRKLSIWEIIKIKLGGVPR